MPPARSAWLLLGGPHRWEAGGWCWWREELPRQLQDLGLPPGDKEAVQPRDLGDKSCCCLLSAQGPLLLPSRDSSFCALRETGPCWLLEGTSRSLLLHEVGCSGAAGLRLEGPQLRTETFWRCQETQGISFPARV